MGAALTYARRYALFTLVGIAGEDDLDAPDLNGALPHLTGSHGPGPVVSGATGSGSQPDATPPVSFTPDAKLDNGRHKLARLPQNVSRTMSEWKRQGLIGQSSSYYFINDRKKLLSETE